MLSMMSMIVIELQPEPEANAMATLAILYPLAFAMVAASTSRAGRLALHHQEVTRLLDHRRDTEKFLQAPPVA